MVGGRNAMHESRLVVDCLVAACTSAMAIVGARFAVVLGLAKNDLPSAPSAGEIRALWLTCEPF